MNQKSPESESLVSHLSELRKRLLSYVICVAVIFIVSIPFAITSGQNDLVLAKQS